MARRGLSWTPPVAHYPCDRRESWGLAPARKRRLPMRAVWSFAVFVLAFLTAPRRRS